MTTQLKQQHVGIELSVAFEVEPTTTTPAAVVRSNGRRDGARATTNTNTGNETTQEGYPYTPVRFTEEGYTYSPLQF